MTELITASFVVTRELKAHLEQWAAADDRSVSYVIRDILKQECDRRQAQQQNRERQAQAINPTN